MVDGFLILVTAFAGFGGMAPPVQQDTARPSPPTAAISDEGVYQRERFVYPTDARRNPFLSLIREDDSGPQFDNLDLMGVIYAGSLGSIATLVDRATDKAYRVRRGEILGNARVVEIRPDAVVFQVSELGLTRSETLRVKKEQQEEQG